MMRRNLVNWSAVLAVAVVVALALPAMAQTPAPAPAPAPAAAPAAKLADTEVAAPAGMTIKVGDTAWIKFGGLLQAQADWLQDTATDGYIQNLFLRRTRLNLAGKVANGVYFFFQTENGSLGKAPKSLGSGFQTLDAVLEWRLDKAFNIQAGLIYVPTTREALKSSVSEMAIDLSAYAYTGTTALTGNGGRDTGVQIRGFLADDALQYRALALQGIRDTTSKYSYRYMGRLQYNFLDSETYAAAFTAYPGSYIGTKKKILSVGTTYDWQRDYQLYSGDIYGSLPFKTGRLEFMSMYQSIDGGTLVTTLPQSHTFTVEAGWYFEALKTAAWGRYELRQYNASDAKDEKRYQAGFNYYVYGNNMNVKAAYGRVAPNVGLSTNQFTLQLQLSY